MLDADPSGLQQASYGYTGIVVAALARYNPFAVVLVAFLSGASRTPGTRSRGADFPSGLVGVMEGMILFTTLGGELLVRYRIRIGSGHGTQAPDAPAEPATAAEAAR